MKYGISKESILRPLLFLLYVHNLSQTLSEAGSYLYVDYSRISTLVMINEAIQDRDHGKTWMHHSLIHFFKKIKTPKMSIQGNNPHIFFMKPLRFKT